MKEKSFDKKRQITVTHYCYYESFFSIFSQKRPGYNCTMTKNPVPIALIWYLNDYIYVFL